MEPRRCLITGAIDRPDYPPWVDQSKAPAATSTPRWPGTLHAWRWTDQPGSPWTGLVTYTRDGLLYHHWIPGSLLEVSDPAL